VIYVHILMSSTLTLISYLSLSQSHRTGELGLMPALNGRIITYLKVIQVVSGIGKN
jgi:hypothetical protein